MPLAFAMSSIVAQGAVIAFERVRDLAADLGKILGMIALVRFHGRGEVVPQGFDLIGRTRDAADGGAG